MNETRVFVYVTYLKSMSSKLDVHSQMKLIRKVRR